MNRRESKELLQNYSYLRSPVSTRKSRANKHQARLSIQLESRAVRLLGGEGVLNFICMGLAEKISNDNVLQQVYGDSSTIALVQLQKELLLLALDDGFSELTQGSKKGVYSQTILQKHVRLGLMDQDEYFDRLAFHLDSILEVYELDDAEAVERCQRRFEATRPLLQVTQEHLMELKSRVFIPTSLGHAVEKFKAIASPRSRRKKLQAEQH